MDSSVQTSSSMRVNLNKGRNKGEGLSKWKMANNFREYFKMEI